MDEFAFEIDDDIDPEDDTGVDYPEPHSADDPWWFGIRSDW